jgi:hypothetical protein
MSTLEGQLYDDGIVVAVITSDKSRGGCLERPSHSSRWFSLIQLDPGKQATRIDRSVKTPSSVKLATQPGTSTFSATS